MGRQQGTFPQLEKKVFLQDSKDRTVLAKPPKQAIMDYPCVKKREVYAPRT
jgi:hypothetical protein